MVASEDVPAGTVEVSGGVSVVVVRAVALAGVVEVNVGGILEGREDLSLVLGKRVNIWHIFLISSLGGFINMNEGLARRIDWPGRLRIKEVGWVWVIGHGHVQESVFEVLVQVLDGLGTVDWSAGLENLVELWPGVTLILVLEVHEEGECVFDAVGALGGVQSGLEISGCDVGEAILRSSWSTLEIEKRSRGGKSTLEGLWVLHSNPRSKHTTIGASKSNDSLIFSTISRLDILDELNVVHHGVLNRKIRIVSLLEGILLLEWETLTEVSVLREHNESTQLFGQGRGNKPTVFIEAPNIAFVSSVEEDWSRFVNILRIIEILVVNDVSNVEGRCLTTCSHVVQFDRELLLNWISKNLAH